MFSFYSNNYTFNRHFDNCSSKLAKSNIIASIILLWVLINLISLIFLGNFFIGLLKHLN